MRDDELTAYAPAHASRAELLCRIALLIEAECGGSSSVSTSRAGIGADVAARLKAGEGCALTVETLLAILYAFPAHAHWLIAGVPACETGEFSGSERKPMWDRDFSDEQMLG